MCLRFHTRAHTDDNCHDTQAVAYSDPSLGDFEIALDSMLVMIMFFVCIYAHIAGS